MECRILKTHTTNVKVQYHTSLPADNYIPFAVAGSFSAWCLISKGEADPAWQRGVSNRMIPVSLVAMPFEWRSVRRAIIPSLGPIIMLAAIGQTYPN